MRTRPACMAARISRSDNTAIGADYRGRPTSAEARSALRVALPACAAARGTRGAFVLKLLALGEQRVDLALELLDVLEALVHAGKPDVGDLIELAELVHGHLTDRSRRHLRLPAGTEGGLDLLGRLIGSVSRNRPARKGARQAGGELFAVEFLAPPVRLGHGQARRLDPFVGGESRRARVALTAPADGGIVDVARVHDPRVTFPAARAAHRPVLLVPLGLVVSGKRTTT